jgi:uncharacterized membrane protein YfcA
MHLDLYVAVAGLIVGFVVGLTGMGGGALMTPMLVFFFGTQPLTAISSDIVASLFMKPAGALVHLRRGTINVRLVGWLCVGSIPAAFSGAWLISLMPHGEQLDWTLKHILGVALLVATSGLVARALFQMWRHKLPFGEGPARAARPEVVVRPIPTLILGALAGLLVGLTSVGAGSIVIVVLLMLYPGLKASSLVGTDLAQAIPLVAAAALGHALFGSVSLTVTGSLLVGALPGVWIGAQISSRAPGGVVRRALAVVLLASGLKLLDVPSELVLGSAIATLVLGSLLWIALRRAARRSARGPAVDRRVRADPRVP